MPTGKARKKKKRIGRPPKSTPATKKLILRCLEKGEFQPEAARKAGVTYSSLKNWRRDNPEFDIACRDAIAVGLAPIEGKIRELAKKGIEWAVKMLLHNRARERWPGERIRIDGDITHRHIEWEAQIGDDDVVRHTESVH